MSAVVAIVLAAAFLALAVVSYVAYGANLRTMKTHLTGPGKPFYRAVRWSYFWEVCLILGGVCSIAATAVSILAVSS